MTAAPEDAPGEPSTARDAARQILASKSKSFALAARLLPPSVASNVVVLYAYCRRADDAVDLAPAAERPQRLAALRAELDSVYSARAPSNADLAAFAEVVRDCEIPRIYVEELLAGMQMDVEGASYATLAHLALYAHRVAGVVGLMMCHVMGVRDRRALPHAAHLGIAMQFTNIARDVLEDWQSGRVYLPDELLARHGAASLRAALSAGRDFPIELARGAALATSDLLDEAERYYASGDTGMRDLSVRCGLAVRTARLVYSAIGARVRAQACDPRAGRAIVPGTEKLLLAGRAVWHTARNAPASWLRSPPRTPDRIWEPTRPTI